jgi:glutamate dehydrogenase
MRNALERTGPVVECYEVEGSRERRLIIGYKQGSTQRYFSALSDLYHWYGLWSSRKYIEQVRRSIGLCAPAELGAVLQWHHHHVLLPQPVARRA